MNQDPTLTSQGLRTPRAAAIAGILFSTLFITSLMLIRSSIPSNPLGSAVEVINHSKAISPGL